MLGPVSIADGDKDVVLGATREASLLAALLLHANHAVATDHLIDVLWGGDPPPGAVATLHSHVRSLRGALEPGRSPGQPSEVLVTQRPGYMLRVDPDALDAWRAERLTLEGKAALDAGDAELARARLDAALALWRGSAYGALAAEPHLRASAVHLDELRITALENRVDADLLLGHEHVLCGELEQLVAEHPFRERLWSQLMLSLYRCGRQVDALNTYQRLRKLLAEELGLEPSTELRELEEAILLQKPHLDRPSSAAERPRGTGLPAALHDALPATSFVGRDDDVQRLSNLVQSSSGVVITVTGPGGIGKTRLAAQVATAAADSFGGDVWIAPLGSVGNPEAVPDVVLTALGGKRSEGASALEALQLVGEGRRLLLVLDNCEHVIAAAAACAGAIVARGDSVVLATSRQSLELAAERVMPVGPLTSASAIELFVDRARAMEPTFALTERTVPVVEEICQRLDGLPLAIELAAARARSLSVQDIDARLQAPFRLLRSRTRGTMERHQSLHATVQWSYDLLDETHRDIFDRLAVFAGGFLSDAVVSVSGDEVMDDFDAVDVLDALVARSMVVADSSRDATRFSLLETMREFGRERLLRAGRMEGCRSRHAAHYLALAERARRQMSTPDGAAAVLTFRDEWSNLRIAFDWFAETGDADGALRVIDATFWYAENSLQLELIAWAERALVIEGAAGHDLWPAVAGATGLLRRSIGDVAGARAISVAARERERELRVPRRVEPTLALLGVHWMTGDYESHSQLLADLEPVAEERNDPVELARTRYARVIMHVVTEREGLGTAAEDAVDDAEARGVPMQLAGAYTGQLAVAHRADRATAARLYPKARGWAQVAGSMLYFDNAALWMAIGAVDDEPRAALGFARDCLVDTFRRGYWGNFEILLRPVLLALARSGCHDTAARLLGGLLELPGTRVESEQLGALMEPVLTNALGTDFPRLVREGRELGRAGLAELAIAEIDRVLRDVVGAADG